MIVSTEITTQDPLALQALKHRVTAAVVAAGAASEVLEATSVAFREVWADARATRPKAATAVKKRILKG